MVHPPISAPSRRFGPAWPTSSTTTWRPDRTGEAWEFIFKYEDPWLHWAASQNWLASIKAAIHLQGLYPNNLLGHAYPRPESDVVDKVRDKLIEVFGSATVE